MKQLSGILNGLKPVSDPYAKVYDSAMERLQDTPETGNTKLGLTILCWLFLAKRPLRLRELLHALAIDEDIPSFDEENVPLSSHIVNACAGLIVVDEAKNTVGLFHKTFHEYLVENQLTLFPQGNDSIGTTCVRYLSFDAFTEGPCLEVDSESLWSKVQAKDRTVLYKKRLNQFTLYEYASEHWHDHVRGGDSETADTITTFLADDNKVSASCQTMQCLVPRTTGVHVVVRHSLSNALVRHLGLCRPQLNYQDNFGRTPLSYAAEMDNLVAASCLIDAGADPNISDEKPADWGNTRWNLDAYNPLSYAAKSGHLQMTELLLEKGACINHQDCRGRDALSYAAQRGSDPVVKMLLKHGSAIDSQDSANRTALCYAAEAGSAEVVSALLEHGANVDQADNRNVTPLLLAARAGSRHTISLLVARGANVNPKCGDNDTPLSRAVEAQLVDSVRLLLRAGAEVDVNTSPRDPLSQACMTGPKEVIPLLLSAGGNVKHLNNRRVPPLAYAARNGWTDIVQLALDKGAAANYADTKSRSVLSYAVEGSSVECVELLLERGAEINRINSHLSFCEQIYYALGMKHYNEGGGDPSPADERMLNLLLSRGANPNRLVKSKRSSIVLQSPLFYAMKHLPAHGPDTKRLLELLLQHGARFDEQDGKESVLICAQQHGVEVQHLLHQYSTI
jgi:ankyrin repeat protein